MQKILIVEDDRLISSVVKIYIQDTDFEIMDVCRSGEEAVRLCRQSSPDLVVMDINLDGELSGIEAARQILTLCNARIIFISGDNLAKIPDEEFFKDTWFLKKPIRKNEFMQIIDSLK